MRLSLLALICFGAGFALYPRGAVAGKECGYVQHVMCPGCVASTPPDSSCFCDINDDGCDCMKATGGIQNGTIIVCRTNDFSYNADPDGFRIIANTGEPCKDVKKCRWGEGNGETLGCAEYVDPLGPGDPYCDEINECEWKKTDSSTTAPVYSQGARC